MFVIDAGGTIVAANLSAYELFRNSSRSFVGAFFPGLFATTIDDHVGEETDSQWKEFKAEMLDRWTFCRTRQTCPSPYDVRVRLERGVGGAGSFIATVRPAPTAHSTV
jgi:hypothetical protein